MATVTRASEGVPSAGGNITSTQLADNFNNIFSFLEGNNIDYANVDYTSTDGIVVMDQAQSPTGLKTWTATAVAGGGIRTVAQFALDPSSGTPAANDGMRLLAIMDDAGGTASNIGAIDVVMTTATAGSEVGRLDFYVAAGGGSIVSQVQVRDGSITPTTTDDISLGTTALNFSDLFLDSGAVINFDSGDVTITHSANALAIAGGTSYTFDALISPATNDAAALGTTSLGWADLHFATGGVINWANGEITITETDSNTLTIAGIATRLDLAAGILELNNAVEWDTGVAVVSTEYSIGRDADVTNQLHFNVPSGAGFEFSAADTAILTLVAATLTLDADLTFTGPQSITTSSGALTLNPATGTILTPSSTTVTGLDITESGAVADSVYGVRVYTNANQQESALVYLHSDNASSDHGSSSVSGEGGVLAISSDGTAAPLRVEALNAVATPSMWHRSGDQAQSPVGEMASTTSNILDDGVGTIFTKAANGWGILVFKNTINLANVAIAIVDFHTSEPVCGATKLSGSGTIAASTADLVGASGADGSITISAHDGLMEVSNRSGLTLTVNYWIWF